MPALKDIEILLTIEADELSALLLNVEEFFLNSSTLFLEIIDGFKW
jgi:hypothetical protein